MQECKPHCSCKTTFGHWARYYSLKHEEDAANIEAGWPRWFGPGRPGRGMPRSRPDPGASVQALPGRGARDLSAGLVSWSMAPFESLLRYWNAGQACGSWQLWCFRPPLSLPCMTVTIITSEQSAAEDAQASSPLSSTLKSALQQASVYLRMTKSLGVADADYNPSGQKGGSGLKFSRILLHDVEHIYKSIISDTNPPR